MNGNIGFILKVLIGSGVLTIAIKHGAPYLEIPASNRGVLAFVFLPSLAMAAILGWKAQQNS